MVRTAFIPARDSRHRTAVCALYRALAKAAAKVTLPGQAGLIDDGYKPIQRILRRRFEKNSTDTSRRLVFASLVAGYKFSSFLNKAQDVKSTEYGELVRYLASLKQPTAQPTAAPRETTDPAEPREPFLIKLSEPGEVPRYKTSAKPRPLHSLGNRRRVPMMGNTAEGIPFLRTAPVQPLPMSRMIGRATEAYRSMIYKIVDIEESLMPAAGSEDHWDRIVAQQMRREQLPCEATSDNVEEEYVWSLCLSRIWYEWKLESTWRDWLARGEAMQRLADAEQELADVEAGKLESTTKDDADSVSTAAVKIYRPKFSMPPLPNILAQAQDHDYFSTQAWADVVNSNRRTMRSWASEAEGARSSNVQ